MTAKLTHWHIDIMTEEQAKKVRDIERAEIYKIPNVPQGIAERFLLAGLTNLKSLIYKGADFIHTMYGLSEPEAVAMIDYCKQREYEMATEKTKSEPVAASAAPDVTSTDAAAADVTAAEDAGAPAPEAVAEQLAVLEDEAAAPAGGDEAKGGSK